MENSDSLTGVLLDDAALDLEEMARACGVDPDWVRRHVQAGMLAIEAADVQWHFRSIELSRARRLASIERDFDANEELAALVVDLADEVRRLRARLHALGVR